MSRAVVLIALILCLLAPLTAWPAQATQLQTQKIEWLGWSDQVFKRARQEKKLVILDLAAVWCHWCHVMDERTYSKPAVIKAVNAHCLAVRVDQDARPDLSNKYQDYGWPATIIFNWDGQELAKKAGFLEAEEMVQLIKTLSKNPVAQAAGSQTGEIRYAATGALPDAMRQKLIAGHLSGYDTVNGAWSFGQKFMDPDSEEFALIQGKAGDVTEAKMARTTLDQQLNLLDPVWGGMSQYSTHNDWKHVHFEKIMSVQADNMRIYALGYLMFHDPRYLAAAESIASYLNSFLFSPQGAFWVSQDADVVPGKHSDVYFKLADADRRKQGVPRVDQHLYARENGWAISGLTALYKASGDRGYLDSAVRAANWVTAKRMRGDLGFKHDEEDAAGPYLGDTLYMGCAFLSLYEVTADRDWLKLAEQAGDYIAGRFKQSGDRPGLVTALSSSDAVAKPEPLLDENIVAARFFNLLSRYDGKDEYKRLATSAMCYLSTPEIADQRKIFVAGILLADQELKSDPVHITIVGSKKDPQAQALFQEALKYPVTYKQVEWYDQAEGPLSGAEVEYPHLEKAAAFGCAFKRCSRPIFQPEAIGKIVDSFSK